MRKLALVVAGSVLAVSTAAAARMGAFAVVSIQDAPDHFVVDRPTTFDFHVLQHGERPVDGLKPTVSARKGIRWVNGSVVPTPAAGVYLATITIPSRGNWAVTIDPGFGPSKGRTGPIRAIAAGEKAPKLTPAERGRQLFASKGCFTCHVHGGVGLRALSGFPAPELTNRRFPPDYLARFLADPSIKPRSPDMGQMPNPRLAPPDIAALVAFINDERKVVAK